jgi:predicted metal-dependent hydrolase
VALVVLASVGDVQSLHDPEFGDIAVRRIARAKSIRVRVLPGGILRATAPPRAALHWVQRLVDDNRDSLRTLIKSSPLGSVQYSHGMRIGQRHQLMMAAADVLRARVAIRGGQVRVLFPSTESPESPAVQEAARRGVEKALRAEAELYLPARTAELAAAYGIEYREIHFGNPKGRWGSCTNEGVIRLNIALMNVPSALSDYVITHELCHILHLDHSAQFWDEVRRRIGDVDDRRRRLRKYSPYI